MKVAIATSQGTICEHFGYCESFTIYHIEEKKIVEKKEVKNPGHRPGFLPVFLSELGVNVIISGGMGSSAINLFNENHITTITGANGDLDKTINKWISGELSSSNSVCNEHQHHGEC